MKKTALITGSSSGLGKAMAIRLAKDGFNIAVNFRGEPERQDALDVQALVRENGSEAEIFGCDVSDFSACKEMTKNVKERFSTIDVLVNNAGITKDGLLARMSEEQFDIVTAVNYKSVFNMTRYVSGVMIKQRSGRIINISSVAGVYGNPGQFNYSASKAGIIGMTLTAAKELGARNITVNAIAPGLIETPMTDSLSEELKSRMLDAVSLGRFGSPQDVAGAVSFLAGEDSAYITGQVLVVDGGLII